MKPIFDPKTRRQFLKGAGGMTLALPLLPSLLPREVEAQAMAAAGQERYFSHFTMWHGCFQSQIFGPLNDLPATETMKYGGHAIRMVPLPTNGMKDGKRYISDTLQADPTKLTPRMLAMMTVINGLDIPGGPGHNNTYPLGGYCPQSIDQVMGASKTFYPTSPQVPVIARNGVSRKDGAIAVSTADSNVKLFDRLFKTSTATDSTVLVDKVKEHADLVVKDPRCGTECKTRLDQYMTMLSEAQSKAKQGVNSSFARPTEETSVLEKSAGFQGRPDDHVKCEQLWNDIVVAAFAAGISRVYVCGPGGYTFGPGSSSDWHAGYAHSLSDPVKRLGFTQSMQRQFEGQQLDLAVKMDAVKGADGKTMLEKGIVARSHELGSGGDPGLHMNRCTPTVMLGTGGGYFKGGLYTDYRFLDAFTWSSGEGKWYSGILYNQWLGMVLRAMGVPPAEYAQTVPNGDPTFGYPSQRNAKGGFTEELWMMAGTDLPWLKA